jgi:serpin B
MVSREAMQTKANLYIGAVVHKAYVAVNEEGAEAAAATAILPSAPTVPGGEPITRIFQADHPFLFLIRDNRSRAILFIGRVNDPTR